MNDTQPHDPAEQRLDEALAALRREEPAEPLRGDRVWAEIEAARRPSAGKRTFLASRSLRRLAAAGVLLAAGALAVQRFSGLRTGVSDDGPRLILADAASIMRALPLVAPGSVDADSLESRSVLLLAATRAAVDGAPLHDGRVPLLEDVEYVLAQVVEGGLDDAVERELTLNVIRSRRLVERATEGGTE